jgi:hypothetical protein
MNALTLFGLLVGQTPPASPGLNSNNISDNPTQTKQLATHIRTLLADPKSGPGLILSPKAGSWEYLYQMLAASPEAIDRAMAALLTVGDIYEPRPGIFKLVRND